MFDAFKNLGDLPGLMAKAQAMQEKMTAVQETLARKQVTADAGDGMVRATVNGRMELVGLKIDGTKIDLSDVELLEEAIVAAVSAAQTKAAQTAQLEMQKVAADLGLPPGMLPG